MIGRTVSHFRIQEKLGQGGMGVVYKAFDSSLNRTVALKFLPEQLSSDETAIARFIQEAQAASALDHLNICSVYEIGETDDGEAFIAMAFYDGQTLKYRLAEEVFPVERMIDVSCQIARALDCAHEAGIVHRDVKPANIMLTKRGEVKLLDFGLAKLIGGAELTIAGSTLGTAAYMSPEQARGSEVTIASDVWALGAVMYEMLTGKKPFIAEYDQALIYGILNVDPQPTREIRPEVPSELSDMVARCLSKDATDRPRLRELISVMDESSASVPVVDVSELREGGRWSGRSVMIGAGLLVVLAIILGVWAISGSSDSATSPTISETVRTESLSTQSVAVLPFRLRSATDSQTSDVFAAGMHDDILAQLAKIAGIQVIARTSVMQFENTTKPVREIAMELGVSSVLEGTIQRAGERVRVNVQLIDADTETQMWGETYDEELTIDNIFSIQTDLARSIAIALQATLSPEEDQRLASRSHVSVEVYDIYTSTNYRWNRRAATVSNLDELAATLEEALEIEPDFAEAQSLLAQIYLNGIVRSVWSPGEKLERVRDLVEDAVELRPDLSDVYMAKGLLHRTDFERDKAEEAYRHAILLSPGEATIYSSLSSLFTEMGRNEEALEMNIHAAQLDPLNIRVRTRLADSHFYAGDYESAAEASRAAVEMDPEVSYAHYSLGYALAMINQSDNAKEAFERALGLEPGNPFYVMALAWTNALLGDNREALDLMEKVENNAATMKEKAIVYGVMGDLDRAFLMLNNSYAENPAAAAPIVGDPSVPKAMRNDPRFVAFAENVGLDR